MCWFSLGRRVDVSTCVAGCQSLIKCSLLIPNVDLSVPLEPTIRTVFNCSLIHPDFTNQFSSGGRKPVSFILKPQMFGKSDSHTYRVNLSDTYFCIGADTRKFNVQSVLTSRHLLPNEGYTALCTLAAATAHLSSLGQPDTLTAPGGCRPRHSHRGGRAERATIHTAPDCLASWSPPLSGRNIMHQ